MRFLFLLVFVGCSSYPEKPHQAEAVALVWSIYPATKYDPPEIEWREEMCKGQVGFLYLGECNAGLYLPGDRAIIAWRGSYTLSAFAHELLHANQYWRGLEDPDHLNMEWGLVQTANEALLRNGIQ